jgi:hypothetical protein
MGHTLKLLGDETDCFKELKTLPLGSFRTNARESQRICEKHFQIARQMTSNISMRLQRNLHNNTLKVTIQSVPAKP